MAYNKKKEALPESDLIKWAIEKQLGGSFLVKPLKKFQRPDPGYYLMLPKGLDAKIFDLVAQFGPELAAEVVSYGVKRAMKEDTGYDFGKGVWYPRVASYPLGVIGTIPHERQLMDLYDIIAGPFDTNDAAIQSSDFVLEHRYFMPHLHKNGPLRDAKANGTFKKKNGRTR